MSPDRTRRWLIIAGIACLIASAAMVTLFDARIDLWLDRRLHLPVDLIAWQRKIDLVFLKRISAVTGVLVAFAGFLAWRAGWLKTRLAMGWGALVATSEYSVDLLKWAIGRERPVDWLAEGEMASDWLERGERSFPSGHVAYYWALVLPLAIRWPKVGVPAIAIALYVTAERMLVFAHHAGDVLASMGIVFLWTAALLPWLQEQAPNLPLRSPE